MYNLFLIFQTIFKRLFKNSGREKGTLRYFREKLNRRKVTKDVKNYEDCEQLFLSVGKCFVVEAFLEFFQMDDATCKPAQNAPNYACVITDEQKKKYISNTLDKFIDKYIFDDNNEDGDEDENEESSFSSDGVCCYSVNVIKSFIVLADIKDAVATGNGKHLTTLHKQLLVHFFAASGFNEYAIEMLINIMQIEIFLSEAEAHKCRWASTVNWNGGDGKNIEIDLFQEVRNKDMKSLIKSMGANKTEKAIERASKASGGVKKTVEAFEKQVKLHHKSSTHSHKSSLEDEKIIMADLRSVKPFKQVEGRKFESFCGISSSPTSSLDEEHFISWIDRHKNNILKHIPVSEDAGSDSESQFDSDNGS